MRSCIHKLTSSVLSSSWSKDGFFFDRRTTSQNVLDELTVGVRRLTDRALGTVTVISRMYWILRADRLDKIKVLFDPHNIHAKSDWSSNCVIRSAEIRKKLRFFRRLNPGCADRVYFPYFTILPFWQPARRKGLDGTRRTIRHSGRRAESPDFAHQFKCFPCFLVRVSKKSCISPVL